MAVKKSSWKKQSEEFSSILKANRWLKLNSGGGGYGSSDVRGLRTVGVNWGGARGAITNDTFKSMREKMERRADEE